jgi:hypothetical protein
MERGENFKSDCVLEDLAVFVVVEFGVVEYLCDILDKLVKVGVTSFLQPSLVIRRVRKWIVPVCCRERLVS